jgi:hypothetical protein
MDLLPVLGLSTALAASSFFLTVVALIALLAATHPDERRRKSASRVLDRLLRIAIRRRRG